MKRKRETAQERDERIVAEVKPWVTTGLDVYPFGVGFMGNRADQCAAAARILNRIARKRGRK
jgi:hypothetical protein